MRLRRTNAIDELLSAHMQELSTDQTVLGDEWIDHRFAIDLGKKYKHPLFDLFKGTECYHDSPPAPVPKTKEYIQLMEKLRRDAEEEEYKKLTGQKESDSNDIQHITKEVNKQLTTIFNILISIVSVAWAFWYWCSSWSLGARTLAALFGGITVAVAEVVVLNGYYRRVNESKLRSELKAKERIKELTHNDTKISEKPKSESTVQVNSGHVRKRDIKTE